MLTDTAAVQQSGHRLSLLSRLSTALIFTELLAPVTDDLEAIWAAELKRCIHNTTSSSGNIAAMSVTPILLAAPAGALRKAVLIGPAP